MKPTLYYAPRTCALATLIALEEAGAEANYVRLDLSKGENLTPAYLKLNPKGRVPSVVTERGPLTESPAILAWIAQTWPHARLAPLEDAWAVAQVNSFNNYLSGSLHGLAFAGVFRSARFADGAAAQAAVKAKALQSVREAFELIESKLVPGRWVHGDAFTTSDAYLAVLFGWLAVLGDSAPGPFPNVTSHAARVRARPAVQRAVAIEQAA